MGASGSPRGAAGLPCVMARERLRCWAAGLPPSATPNPQSHCRNLACRTPTNPHPQEGRDAKSLAKAKEWADSDGDDSDEEAAARRQRRQRKKEAKEAREAGEAPASDAGSAAGDGDSEEEDEDEDELNSDEYDSEESGGC